MTARAFCPGHITCFFRSHVVPEDILRTGSSGAGLCVDKGAIATVRKVPGKEIFITFSGQENEAPVTRKALELMGCHGLEVDIVHQLPLSQGMGMSAAGSVAACLAATDITNMDMEAAFRAVHRAEVLCGCGLGDVSGLTGYGQSTRVAPGLPPYGKVQSQYWDIELSLAMVGGPLSTSSILQDDDKMECIDLHGARYLREYLSKPDLPTLMKLSSEFSTNCALESEDVQEARRKVEPYVSSGMCMLGNSIYMIGELEAAEKILGVPCIRTRLDLQGPRIIRKE